MRNKSLNTNPINTIDGKGMVIDAYRRQSRQKQTTIKGLLGESFPTIHPYDNSPQQDGTVSTSGTSIFDPVLCEVCYSWFCPNGGEILDPFAGGSVRGIVAAYLGFHYTGIDLREEQIEENKKQAHEILTEDKPFPSWIVGNSLQLDSLLEPKKQFDFIFSCPPYFDLEIYSEKDQDLSTLSWEEFCSQYKMIIHLCLAHLKQDRFACFVVSDVRDENGFYRMLPEKTKEYFTVLSGVGLYNDIILVNVVGSLPIRIGKSFGNYRKVGRRHQHVLVFFKGDPKTIKENFGVIDVNEIVNTLNL
jgi:DNA modification methylase